MSGIRTCSRLHELQALRNRATHDLDQARARGDVFTLRRLHHLIARVDVEIVKEGGTKPAPVGVPRGRKQKAEDRVTRHLERLGVTAHDVKVWAVGQGLVDRVRRGRIRAELVAAYDAAHSQDATA